MQRHTKQRQSILAALTSARRPLSVAEMHDMATRDIPSLGIATVYRTVKSLLEEESIVLVSLPGNTPYYELAGKHHHHHFQCGSCNTVIDIDACLLDSKKLSAMQKKAGLLVHTHDITLFGTCASCR